ncbi:glycerophosphodiester phosphodiesterase family protein [Shinella kummerowiae]|uniref:glycerophosphodiester phosphodiesterase family protein n=1 Tax=Shinella kummerowiae TaxID=417745 RepID=UPI0021B56D9C|nr:glycerophosphodiester phosphodiesterase family protein [Shinella kummerowiae]MCT7662667.1 glycerophosphodiester phosphodiesterase family protein [Shinella kummerowiae]
MRNTPIFVLGLALLVWSFNSSLIASAPDGDTKLLAHRGAHQTFGQAHVENDTCTATLIDPPTHDYLENTIAGMRAAFAAGADVVEIDVHLTPDKKFAVFHDWTLDCRTDGKGVTEETDSATLKTLDIGYGYTADGGKTYPFRGKGIGQMPMLEEIFAANPAGKLLINFKSRRAEEGEALAAMLEANPAWRDKVFGVYGGGEPTDATLAAIPGLKGYTGKSAKACLLNYLGTGWIGYVPEACRNTLVPVPSNYAWLLWGWPNRFMTRMKDAGSDVILVGPYGSGDGTVGIDTAEQVENLPEPFSGYIWTNRILDIAPAVAARR